MSSWSPKAAYTKVTVNRGCSTIIVDLFFIMTNVKLAKKKSNHEGNTVLTYEGLQTLTS